MIISQKEYHRQYYLKHKKYLRNKRIEYYYKIRGTTRKLPKSPEQLKSELNVECPRCHKLRTYTFASNSSRARRTNSICNSCANVFKLSGRQLTEQHKTKISIGNTGKIISDETKRKLREIRVNELQSKFFITPNYNANACHYFDNLSKQRGWKLQHALNGGEVTKCGYFLDAYDPILNIVVEYDEKKHHTTRQKHRDEQKQKEVIAELKCHFYRYDETTKILTQIT